MILYFADRHLNILGQASTNLPDGIKIIDDRKTDDIETGVSIFECDIAFDRNTRNKVEQWAEVGNYILRSSGEESEFYNIIDAEIDSKKKRLSVYAEDDGLDLLNEVVGEYEADQYYPISFYVNKYASGAGWEIGVNEVEGLTRKLSFDTEQTASARLLKIAEHFDKCELSFSFKIEGLQVTKKYINIFEKRGKDTGIQLRLNKEIDSIVTTKSIANLATALQCTGETPDNEENPITLRNYSYDDGDFYVDGSVLKSRKALKKWSRYLWKNDETQQAGGHIVKQFSYITISQAELCEKAIEQLKTICDMEVNYDIDITKLSESVKVGDRINVIDDASELYLSSRVLILETSVVNNERRAVIGEHLIKKDGISQKVSDLASQFAKASKSAERALTIANSAKVSAESAQMQAESVVGEVEAAQQVANEAKQAAETAAQSATEAQEKANAAQAAVEVVESSVSGLETTITNAQNAANNAQQAAQTAQTKAEEAKTAAEQAKTDAEEAKTAAGTAQIAAESAVEKANAAQGSANEAKTQAAAAQSTAAGAKADAEQAAKDIEAFGENLETVENTMKADYARKTDLTEATASLQTQITQNANEISSTASRLTTIDETANNAASQATQAQAAASAAQEQATQAAANAQAAQTAADTAAQTAANAQSEADTAKAAAETAQSVADKAKTDLEEAKADLATVTSRVDATEEEITAAQEAVSTAQAVADKAQEDATVATTKANEAQTKADTAFTNATNAQTAANNAATQAALAQATADEAKGDASAAQQAAEEAAATAAEAQRTADTAKTNATNAQATADAAAQAAQAAQAAADDADAKAAQAASDLATAQQNLAAVTSRVDATAEEVEAAQAAVEAAQAAANKAEADAIAAQSTADTAKANAATAQTAANNAKTAADNAQTAANEAKSAADKAQSDVNALAVRVTTAETNITQNSEMIALSATKEEVTETLGGYYTKTQTEALVKVESDAIKLTVGEAQGTADSAISYLNEIRSELSVLADSVVTLVEDETGNSILTQTKDGWTFSTAKIQSDLASTSEALDGLTETLGSTEAAVDVLNQSVGDITKKTDYIHVGTYEYTSDSGATTTEPSIELWQTQAANEELHKLIITNKRILFQVGANEPTRIVFDGLITENITVENELRHKNDEAPGTYVWEMDSLGYIGLQWKGNEA